MFEFDIVYNYTMRSTQNQEHIMGKFKNYKVLFHKTEGISIQMDRTL